MSVNVFGSRFKTKSSVDTSVYSKFVTLVKNMQTKLDKSGDKMTGTLEMCDNKISDLADPVSDNDASNKKYVKSEIKAGSILTKLYIDTLLGTKLDKHITEDLNMNGKKINGLENPTNDDEVCSKKYLDSKIKQENTLTKRYIDCLLENIGDRLNRLDTYNTLSIQKDDITAENIFGVGAVINNLFKEKGINAEQFAKSFHRVEKLCEQFIVLFEIVHDSTSENIPDILKCCILD